MKSPITTHVLDTSRGAPAAGVAVTLSQCGAAPRELAHGVTDADGRITNLLPAGSLQAGDYRLTFAVGDYFASQQLQSFYPQAAIDFRVQDPQAHYHVPLLLSPFGYSTYRGS